MICSLFLLIALGLLGASPAWSTPPSPPSPRGPSWVGAPDGRPMVFVPAGPFLQGSAEGPYHEGPARQVVLDAFFIDLTEVSNEAYERFRRATGHRAPRYASDAAFNRPNQPVVGVDWFGAAAYCAWAGKRLATEAEWEKAARGPEGRRYPWGDTFAPEKVNGLGASGGPEAVGGRPGGASPYGALHTAGNVWEWVADFYADDYYRKAPARNPLGPPSGFLRVIKGGSYRNGPEHLRSAVRFRLDPVVRWKSVGFRCARDAGPPGGRRPPRGRGPPLVGAGPAREVAPRCPPGRAVVKGKNRAGVWTRQGEGSRCSSA